MNKITIYKKLKKNKGNKSGEFSALIVAVASQPWEGKPSFPIPKACTLQLLPPFSLEPASRIGFRPGRARTKAAVEAALVPSLHRVASLRGSPGSDLPLTLAPDHMQAALGCTQHLSNLLRVASKPTKTKGEIIQGLGNKYVIFPLPKLLFC